MARGASWVKYAILAGGAYLALSYFNKKQAQPQQNGLGNVLTTPLTVLNPQLSTIINGMNAASAIPNLIAQALSAIQNLPKQGVVNRTIGDVATAQLPAAVFNTGVSVGAIIPYSAPPTQAGYYNGFYYDPKAVNPAFARR